MAAPFIIVAGGPPTVVQLVPLPAGSVFDAPPNLGITSDDSNVVITPDATDPTGTIFQVSTPASDTATTTMLTATGVAGGVQISGLQAFDIVTSPPPPATGIAFTVLPGTRAPAAAGAPSKGRAPAK